ncbi:MAG: hypothetical protein AB7I41_07370 [Candidatus Sericytochromatia bacterium]
MAKWIELSLPLESPREKALFAKIPIHSGMSQAYTFAGVLTLLGAAGTLVPLLLMPSAERMALGPILMGGLFFTSFSLFFFQLAKSYARQRLRFLLEGKLIKAQVLRQGSRFNPFSSTPHTTLTLALDQTNSDIQGAPLEVTGVLWKRDAARDLKPGCEVWILALPSETGETLYWCPFEVGLLLRPL